MIECLCRVCGLVFIADEEDDLEACWECFDQSLDAEPSER